MAKKRSDITDLEAAVPRHSGRKPRQTKWDELLDGSVYELVKGKDFKSVANARACFATYAKRKGGRAVTRVTKDGNLLVQCVLGSAATLEAVSA